jgi:hypothetical protein
VLLDCTQKVHNTAMLTNYWKAKMFYTTISNLRKNLSEGDRGLWQEVWVFEILKDISSNIYSGFSGIFNLWVCNIQKPAIQPFLT